MNVIRLLSKGSKRTGMSLEVGMVQPDVSNDVERRTRRVQPQKRVDRTIESLVGLEEPNAQEDVFPLGQAEPIPGFGLRYPNVRHEPCAVVNDRDPVDRETGSFGEFSTLLVGVHGDFGCTAEYPQHSRTFALVVAHRLILDFVYSKLGRHTFGDDRQQGPYRQSLRSGLGSAENHFREELDDDPVITCRHLGQPGHPRNPAEAKVFVRC
jgi:hypothetical protein